MQFSGQFLQKTESKIKAHKSYKTSKTYHKSVSAYQISLAMFERGYSIHMTIDDKLALNLFHVDKEPHIKVNQEICLKCPHRLCTCMCPVENYKLEDDNVVFSWEGCLECGTCRIVCDQGAIAWDYPRGGYGISYRF